MRQQKTVDSLQYSVWLLCWTTPPPPDTQMTGGNPLALGKAPGTTQRTQYRHEAAAIARVRKYTLSLGAGEPAWSHKEEIEGTL